VENQLYAGFFRWHRAMGFEVLNNSVNPVAHG